MMKKSLGINLDCGLGCIFIGMTIVLIGFDIDLKNFIVDDNNEVTRLLSHIENSKSTVYIEELKQNAKVSKKDYRKCTHFDCFDIYRCGVHHQKLLVHVPEPKQFLDHKGNPIAPLTQDFVSILEAIAGSEYYTEDYNEACVFIPALDLLNQRNLKTKPGLVQGALEKSSDWQDGQNHLIFSIFSSTEINSSIGKSMRAAAGISDLDYRPGYDISLPAYSLHQEKPAVQKDVRQLLAVMPQIKNIKSHLKRVLKDIEGESTALIKSLENCVAMDDGDERCDTEGNTVKYPEILSDSTFCIVLDTEYDSGQTITEALHHGCIPVIISSSTVLPFSEVIDWKRFSIRLHEIDLSSIQETLSNVSQKRISEMQQQIHFVYEKYFSSWKAIVNTTLLILNDRIVPHHAKNYKHWNLPPTVHESNPLFLRNVPPESDGFTAVILTYDRVDSLFNVIKKISETPSLAKIVVVWNNQEKAPPPASSWPKISPKSLKVIKTHANLLSNRFYPYEEINTEAILSLDDDINMLTSDELEYGYQVWREFPDQLVGFPSRTHVWEDSKQKLRYEPEWTSEISMVLTGAAFYHKYWHYLFTAAPSIQAQEIKQWVDDHMNCEDIAMNFLIANATRKAPIKVAPRKKFKCSTPQCYNQDMQLSGDQSHLVTRSQCINLFAEKYGYVPLKAVEWRADPVLYKDDIPEKLKKYSNLGSL